MPFRPGAVARRQMRVGGKQRQRIRRRDEDALADDQVAVAVAVGRRAEIRRVLAHHLVVEMLGVDQVGIGMMAAEIRQRHEVARRALAARRAGSRGSPWRRGRSPHAWRRSACGSRRRTSSRIAVEIEQRLHQRGIVGDRIDDLDGHVAGLDACRPCRGRLGRCRRSCSWRSPCVRAKIASVIFSGAGPPLPILYLMPKSSCGPPGLWLADRISPPNALYLRMTCEAAGVDRMPPCPTMHLAEAVGGGHARWRSGSPRG